MHILLICHEFPPTGGGVATAGLRMTEAFVRKGACVTVLTAAYADLPLREERQGYTVIRLCPGRRHADTSNLVEFGAFMVASMWWAVRTGRKSGANVCMAMMGMPGGPAAWLLHKTAQIPYVVSLRGGDVPGHQPEQMATMHTVTAPFIRRIWRDAAAVVANSEGLAELARAHAPWVQVSVIRNGVDSQHFAPRGPVLESVPPCLLYTGRLSEGKNVNEVLTALARLRELPELPELGDLPWSLHLAGDGPLRPELEASVRQLGLDGHVHFHGWVGREDMPEMYRMADIFVFPSSGEGTSNSLLEAMACGLPIVTHAVRGCTELVEDGVNGYAVPEGDADKLTTALRSLIENATLRTAMGTRSRARIEAAFSWERCAADFFTIFERIACNAHRQ